jgi:sterol desaturase/sphingolipid hydroxylase (fatty acid hydroxylase superfamily)
LDQGFAMPEISALIAQTRPAGSFLLVAVIFMVMEYVYLQLALHDEAYDVREAAASFGVALGNISIRTLTSGLTAAPFFLFYKFRLFDIPLDRASSWIVLFLGTELLYYWFHRASHRVRWLWATHAVHHSAQAFNLTAAVRLGWTGTLTGSFVFFLPLAWLGFHPVAIAAMLGFGLMYQFFLHTAVNVRLGPLEWVLNTPAHHQVHHASNEACLDKNYGSVLIVFDRLFGTFADAPRDERLRFGLKGQQQELNPVQIALGEWMRLASDVRQAKGLRDKLRTLFGTP